MDAATRFKSIGMKGVYRKLIKELHPIYARTFEFI
jgi:hypothetical protein